MSRLIQQPINQVKLTNVAVVRLQLQGKRFEIACYRNKILDYRSGHETDLTEVLQSDRVFVNVSKGQFANTKDLQQVFNTTDQDAIAKTILNHPKSILQVSDKERELQHADGLARIATWMAAHCVHPTTQRPYTVPQLQQALAGYNVQPHKPLKKQYLDAYKYLKTQQQNGLEIERAKMELALVCAAAEQVSVLARLQQLDPVPVVIMIQQQQPMTTSLNDGEETSLMITLRLQADPSLYRPLEQLAQSIAGGKLEIVQQQVTASVEEEGAMAGGAVSSSMSSYVPLPPVDSNQPKATTSASSKDDEAAIRETLVSVSLADNHDKGDDESASEDEASEDDEQMVAMSRKQLRQQQKKHSKQAKRHQQSDQQDEINNGAATDTQENSPESASAAPASLSTSAQLDPNVKSCNTCGGWFPTAAAYRTHFKSDWHRYNQKLKLQGLAPISELEFDLVDSDAFFSEAL